MYDNKTQTVIFSLRRYKRWHVAVGKFSCVLDDGFGELLPFGNNAVDLKLKMANFPKP